MAEYLYDKDSVQALIEWGKNAHLPQEIELSKSEYIFNLSKYVQANIYDIEQHNPDEFYNPAITRLYRIKELIEQVGT